MGGRRDEGGTSRIVVRGWKLGYPYGGEKMEVREKIRETLISLLKLKPNEIKDEVKLCDGIGVDSTEMVEVVIALEKAFGVKLSAKEITKFHSVNDIEKVIQSKYTTAINN